MPVREASLAPAWRLRVAQAHHLGSSTVSAICYEFSMKHLYRLKSIRNHLQFQFTESTFLNVQASRSLLRIFFY